MEVNERHSDLKQQADRIAKCLVCSGDDETFCEYSPLKGGASRDSTQAMYSHSQNYNKLTEIKCQAPNCKTLYKGGER